MLTRFWVIFDLERRIRPYAERFLVLVLYENEALSMAQTSVYPFYQKSHLCQEHEDKN